MSNRTSNTSLLACITSILAIAACSEIHIPADQEPDTVTTPHTQQDVQTAWRQLAEDDWKRILTNEQFRIARNAGTERPFTGQYWKDNGGKTGVFKCVACRAPLFTREAKFFSACGWPAFHNDVQGKVSEHADHSHGMIRTEVRCQTCDSHLGHVFNDGPPEHGGLRYCINSQSIVYDAEGTIHDPPLTPDQRLSAADHASNKTQP